MIFVIKKNVRQSLCGVKFALNKGTKIKFECQVVKILTSHFSPFSYLEAIKQTLLMLKELMLPRVIEEKMLLLIRKGQLAKWFSGWGQEAVAVGCTLALDEQDWILPMHRNHGVWTSRGLDLKQLFCQLMEKEGGFTQGRDRTYHFGLPEKRLVGMISHLGAMYPVACGLALAQQLKGEKQVALAFLGEGASREGDFHEALSLAGIWKLPVIFVVENNGYGLSTPTATALPVEDLYHAAKGYGIVGKKVDGNDIEAVVEAVKVARKHALAGKGATLLEMKTFRVRGHEEASGTKYVPQSLIEEWEEQCPLKRYQNKLLSAGKITQAQIDELRQSLKKQVDEAVAFAQSQPANTSTPQKELADVFADLQTTNDEFLPLEKGETQDNKNPIKFFQAVSDALKIALEEDEKVLLMGQDIAEYGGIFKITDGFLQRFGKERIRNTPIIESGVVGAAMGLALEGFKPVVEMQYADFISCAFNQIVNNLATTHYRWGTPINVTIRAPFGGHIGAGPFHSQSPEAWFTHVPGIKVVVPSNPTDAKGLLLSAIDDPNPVLFLEHKFLYRKLSEEVPQNAYRIPLGKAKIVHSGSDLTIISYGIGVYWAMQEAAHWLEKGKSIEVVDLRTLIPWDKETVLVSLHKTNKVLILHEARQTSGFGAEIAAFLSEHAFSALDAPIIRIAAEDFPVPFATQLEQECYAAEAKLRAGVEKILSY